MDGRSPIFFTIIAVIVATLSSVSFISMTGFVTFEGATPSAGSTISSTSVTVNATVPQVQWLESFIYTWSGTNYTILNNSLILMMNFDNLSVIGESNGNVVDLSGNNHNGTVSGATFTEAGKYGGAFGFDGNDSIAVENVDDFNINGFSVSMWIDVNNITFSSFRTKRLHSCAITEENKLFCWGYNNAEQIGDGTTEDSLFAIPVFQYYNFSRVYPGTSHTCGVLTNGSTVCWGDNTYGTLGNGVTGGTSSTPVFVSGNQSILSMTMGYYHTCGLLQNGSLVCWGRDNYDQLGCDNCGDKNVPTNVSGNYNFSHVSAGYYHTCGVLQNGSALCWGRNNDGQVGDNSTSTRSVPTTVFGNHSFYSIDAGIYHTCAALTNGSLMCWGENDKGQIGDGTTTMREIPTPVSGNYNFSSISLGLSASSCGELTNGSMMCWGVNQYNNFGVISSNYNTPLFLDSSYVFDSFYTGSTYFCGLDGGNVYCLGEEGRLGIGAPRGVNSPWMIDNSYSFSSVQHSNFMSCGLLQNGSTVCWGSNFRGQKGNPEVVTLNTPSFVSGGHAFSVIGLGVYHACGLLQNGSAVCWGSNDNGQIGDGTVTERGSPVFVSGTYNFSGIFSGTTSYHTCGLLQNGSALCWGRSDYGQVGNGTTTSIISTPAFVSGNYNFSSMAFGISHTCGLLQNGSLVCWGRDNYDQLGCDNCGDKSIPSAVSGNHNFSQVSSGAYHTCGLLQNGSALCWGRNTNGQVGDDSVTTRSVPTNVFGNHNFSSILGGGLSYTCGLLINGSALCWGINDFGQLGNGTSGGESDIPASVIGDYNFTIGSTGVYGICAKTTDSEFYCWGRNNAKQLGPFEYSREYLTPVFTGQIFGKESSYFSVYSSTNKKIAPCFGERCTIETANQGWNLLTFVYHGTSSQKLYLNGEMVSESTDFSPISDSRDDFVIGKGFEGKMDELRVYNRSLSAAEVAQLYRSNLRKVNATDWNFESTHTSLSDASYTFAVHAEDTEGNKSSAERTFTVDAVPDQTPDTSTYRGTSSSYTISTTVEEKWTHTYEESDVGITEKESVTVVLQKNERLKLNFTGAVHYIGITDMNESTAQVNISFADEEITITTGQSVTFDLNKDGVDDIEVTAGEPGDDGMKMTVSYIESRQLSEEVEEEPEPEVIEEVVLPVEKQPPHAIDPSLVGAAIAIAAAVIGGAFYKERGKIQKKKTRKSRKKAN